MSRHSSTSHAYSGNLGGAAGAGVVMIGVLVIVLAVYLVVKTVNLLVRVFSKYPKNRALVTALGCTVGTGILSLAIHPFAILAVLCFLGLIATARIVELYYDDKFQQEGTLMNNVLRKSWWQGNNQLKKAA